MHLGTLARLSVHPASPVLLTKNGPLGALIQRLGSTKQPRLRTYLKFENRLKMLHPRTSNHSLYPIQLIHELQLSWGKLRREPATRWFD